MSTAHHLRRSASVVGVTGIFLIALAGCSTAGDLVNQVSTESFSTAAELEAGWDEQSPWLPADATGITARWSTRDDAATLLVVSDDPLDPSRCAEISRESVPIIEIDNAPDAYSIDRVYACGEWTVAATDNGWLGWTPNDPDERAQSPTG